MPKASIVIPTLNGGPLFAQGLRSLFGQKPGFDFEVIVIDSGSKDGTLEELARHPVRLLHTAKKDFNHGLTRTQAAGVATGEFLVFLTQDAEPTGPLWLANLLRPFEDPAVAGTYARVLPRPDASPLVERKVMQDLVYGTERLVKRIDDRAAWDRAHPFERRMQGHFNNVCSAIRASVFKELPFRKIDFGEDLDWGLRALEAGHAIVFEPTAEVWHSHPTRLREDYARYRADAKLMLDLLGFVNRSSWKAAVRAAGGEVLKDWEFLRRKGLWPLLRYGAFAPVLRLTQTFGQLAGSRLVARAAAASAPRAT
ncbi:MAG: glycosyltransferase family 2 protein [Planctomycetes bacterium]|nr:glycosyltransferase family 2 protein [Planctomycetota bacterium]